MFFIIISLELNAANFILRNNDFYVTLTGNNKISHVYNTYTKKSVGKIS